MHKLLTDFKVLDLSHRLPGPLAGHALVELGAQVTKIEDTDFGDPFKDGFFKEMDRSFHYWYKELNAHKEIISLSFKDMDAPEELLRYIDEADIIILGLPQKLLKKFHLEDQDILSRSSFKKKAFIKMAASRNKQVGMHDLNVLARLGLLGLYTAQMPKVGIIPPPFLPIAGISYGSFLATTALAALLKAQKNDIPWVQLITLQEAVQILLKPFFSDELKESGQRSFLHNGRFPCYNLYPLKDHGFLAVAALEPKYWRRFCQLLDLEFTDEERFFHQEEAVFTIIAKRVKSLTLLQAQELFLNTDCCVDIVAN